MSAEGFGCRPIAALYDQLRVVWYPKFQTWGTPVFSTTNGGLADLRVELTLDQDKVLHVKYDLRGVECGTKFDKLWEFPTPPVLFNERVSNIY